MSSPPLPLGYHLSTFGNYDFHEQQHVYYHVYAMFVPRSWWILRSWWPNSRPPPDPRGSQGGSPGQQFLPRQVGPVRRETFRRWSDRWRVCSLATGDSGDPDDPRSSRQSLNVGKSTRPGYDVYRASHGFSMALIEIDGLPNLKMVIFHRYSSINPICSMVLAYLPTKLGDL